MTFEELGIPFKLFEADSDECDSYRGVAACSLCSTLGHVFDVPAGGTATFGPACYQCLRAGRFTYPKKTEPGFTPEQLTELARTPDHTGQDVWPACCQAPMIFLGTTDDALLPTGPDAVTIGDFGNHGTGWHYHLYRCQTCGTVSACGEK